MKVYEISRARLRLRHGRHDVGVLGDVLEIILRPDIRAAEMQLDIDHAWDGENVYEDVALRYNDAGKDG
jgi:hypothetical protein